MRRPLSSKVSLAFSTHQRLGHVPFGSGSQCQLLPLWNNPSRKVDGRSFSNRQPGPAIGFAVSQPKRRRSLVVNIYSSSSYSPVWLQSFRARSTTATKPPQARVATTTTIIKDSDDAGANDSDDAIIDKEDDDCFYPSDDSDDDEDDFIPDPDRLLYWSALYSANLVSGFTYQDRFLDATGEPHPSAPEPTDDEMCLNDFQAAVFLLNMTRKNRVDVLAKHIAEIQDPQRVYANAEDKENNRMMVRMVHKGILVTLQRCVSILRRKPILMGKNTLSFDPADAELDQLANPFIIFAMLKLTERSRQLGLPIHLPLYESIATVVAKYGDAEESSVNDFLTLAKMAQTDYASKDDRKLQQEVVLQVLNSALVTLPERDRISDFSGLTDLVGLLKGLRDEFGVSTLPVSTVQPILHAYKTYIEQVWDLAPTEPPLSTDEAGDEQDGLLPLGVATLKELMAWLEPSIWKIFDYTPTNPTDQARHLRDALEVLLSLDDWDVEFLPLDEYDDDDDD